MVNSKQKGNAWENKIAKEIRAMFIPPSFDAKTAHSLVHRTPMSGGHVEKGDLIVKPPIWKFFPWFIECRNRQSWSFKNIMEKPDDSIIMKWFMEDAVEKCHPYDNHIKYPRIPLLLFTRNQHKTYFCTWESNLHWIFRHHIVVDVFRPLIHVWRPTDGQGHMHHETAVIGVWDNFLAYHAAPMDKITNEINKYLGDTNGIEESPDLS